MSKAYGSLGARLPIELSDKFNERCHREGRVKKRTITRLLKEYINMRYPDILEEGV